MMTIAGVCPMCGQFNRMEIKGKRSVKKICDYYNGKGMVQNIPLCASTREFIKTGMCKPCQKIFFAPEEEEVTS